MALTCLETLVGLSARDFACFTDTRPDNYNESDSGYYLTDTDYGLSIAEQCEVAGWGMLQDALDQAILETKDDLRASLRSRYDSALSPFNGFIGKLRATATVSAVSGTHIGLRLRIFSQRKGAKFTIKSFRVALDTSGTYSIQIRSNDPLFVAPSNTALTAVANTFSTATPETKIELPLYSASCPDDYLEYYISLSRGGAKPLNNTFKCCGDTPSWMRYFEAHGFQASDNIATNASTFQEAQGFALEGFLTCDGIDWLCGLDEMNNYDVRSVLARTIQFRGAAIAISALIEKQKVSPCTGYHLETLVSKAAHLNKTYGANITWLTQNLPAGVTDCFVCKPERVISKTQILV